ncbi:hypothetical protein AB0I28_35815 [Phytomonospora sp. NPDC050363]|uniref:hypothetical protein n=1 Tax=Phytomonospora sp. NPDC050363 TaxID=3155642 RepID=UPI003405B71A
MLAAALGHPWATPVFWQEEDVLDIEGRGRAAMPDHDLRPPSTVHPGGGRIGPTRASW